MAVSPDAAAVRIPVLLACAACYGVALAWAGRYGNAPHPFACVVTPRLPAPGATVMADFWFYAG